MTAAFTTADLCDEFPGEVQVLEPVFRDFGGRRRFAGGVSTVRCFEDNSLVRQALERPGRGRVLVVDGGGSMRCALLGDMLAQLAMDNGWQGVVVFGCIRDSAVIADMDLGVRALGTHPMKSVKRNQGEADVQVHFAGVQISPGQILHADQDGIVVSAPPRAG